MPRSPATRWGRPRTRSNPAGSACRESVDVGVRRLSESGSVCSQSCMALLSAEPAASAAPAPTKPRRLSMRSIPVNSVRTAAVRSGAHGRPSGLSAPWTSRRLPARPCRHEPEVLDGHDTAESLGEQSCQYSSARDRAGTSPVSIQRRTREVSVASWGWPMAAACRLTSLASSPLDQPARPNRSSERVLGPLLTSSPQVLG